MQSDPGTVTTSDDHTAVTAYLDLDATLIEERWAPRGPELFVRPGVSEGLARLREVVMRVVVLVEPLPSEVAGKPDQRVVVLRDRLGSDARDLLIVECPHRGEDEAVCDCRKPGVGLVDLAREAFDLDGRSGWHIGGDQLGVQAGRAAGLRTIRVGPIGEDHLSAVHRADHDARDLLSAANVVMMETLTAV